MIFALAGNQNCGKTTLFNALTGSNQHVGNFPGVTVDQKSGETIWVDRYFSVGFSGVFVAIFTAVVNVLKNKR